MTLRDTEFDGTLEGANARLNSLRAELEHVQQFIAQVEATRCSQTDVPLLAADAESVFTDQTGVAAVLVDRAQRILRANSAFRALFHAPAPVGLSLDDVVTEYSGSATPWATRGPVASGAWERRDVQTSDGRWFSRRAIPVLDKEGNTAGGIITFSSLEASALLEKRLKLAMASARLVCWEWDFGTGTMAIYGDRECFLGFSIDTLPRSGGAWFESTHPDDLLAVRTAVEDCMAGRAGEFSIEHRLRAADGSWRWVLNSGRPSELDALGRPARMLGIVLDTHARRAAEEHLRRDARILAQLQTVVIYCDANYRIEYVNDAFERVLGHPKAGAIGRDATYRLPPAAREEARAYQQRIAAGEAFSMEWEDHRADGSRVWMDWRCQRVVDEQGQVSGFINIGTDIDARKRSEVQREQLQQQLIRAQRMETLGTLAGGIAHDFNNILTAIFGFTEIALNTTNPNEVAKHYHSQVLKAAERARELVKRILSFSRFHEPERRPIRLSDLIDDASKFIRAALPSIIELEIASDRGCPPTLADPHQLHQVLLNLATNAAHAIGEKAGKIQVHLRCETLRVETEIATGKLAPSRYALIEVMDNGHGMDAGTLAKVFDPFFTTKKEGEGTGLGLSVANAIMRGHGGGIAVRSALGKGTTFTAYVPIVGKVEVPVIAPEEMFAARRRARGETIAIIDDEEMVATMAEKSLQMLGYSTQSFPSAERFIQAFYTAPSGIHLLLTDQTMPKLTGIELALRLRQDGYRLPILIMTGFSTQLQPEIILSVAPAAVIKKPFSSLELALGVRDLLDANLSERK